MAAPNHTQLRLSLGAYVLGSLDPADRAALDAHLPGCGPCQDELAAFATIPGLLSRVTLDQVRHATLPTPPPAVLHRALAAVATERNNTVTHLLWWRRTTVLSAAALVVAVLLGVTLTRASPPTSFTAVGTATLSPAPPQAVGTPPSTTLSANPATPLSAAPGVSAAGSVSLEAKPWGTAVTLQLHDLPQGAGFTAWVTATDGTRRIAATWSPTPNGRADLTGAANIPTTNLAAVQIDQGTTTLLTLTPHR